MKLRIARKINATKAADDAADRPRRYSRPALHRASRRMRLRFQLESDHACSCGRQRYRPSAVCTYQHCPRRGSR